MKESAAKMEKIPSTIVLHKHIYGLDTIFATISVPFVNNTLRKWIDVIRRGIYQVATGDIMC